MSTITKQQMVEMVAEGTNLTKKDVKMVIEKFFDKVEENLVQGNKVQLQNIGTFEAREVKERTTRNPRNPEETIFVPAHRKPVLKFSGRIKEKINA